MRPRARDNVRQRFAVGATCVVRNVAAGSVTIVTPLCASTSSLSASFVVGSAMLRLRYHLVRYAARWPPSLARLLQHRSFLPSTMSVAADAALTVPALARCRIPFDCRRHDFHSCTRRCSTVGVLYALNAANPSLLGVPCAQYSYLCCTCTPQSSESP